MNLGLGKKQCCNLLVRKTNAVHTNKINSIKNLKQWAMGIHQQRQPMPLCGYESPRQLTANKRIATNG